MSKRLIFLPVEMRGICHLQTVCRLTFVMKVIIDHPAPLPFDQLEFFIEDIHEQ